MKLNNLVFDFDKFASEMANLKEKKHFDYLVTIIGEDFGEEGLGCIYILENTENHERTSVKMIARQIDGEHVIAKGKVEKVIVDGETSHYRLVVGTTREAIDEYVKLKESPA